MLALLPQTKAPEQEGSACRHAPSHTCAVRQDCADFEVDRGWSLTVRLAPDPVLALKHRHTQSFVTVDSVRPRTAIINIFTAEQSKYAKLVHLVFSEYARRSLMSLAMCRMCWAARTWTCCFGATAWRRCAEAADLPCCGASGGSSCWNRSTTSYGSEKSASTTLSTDRGNSRPFSVRWPLPAARQKSQRHKATATLLYQDVHLVVVVDPSLRRDPPLVLPCV